jgi:DNA topoisomerase I
MTNLVIFESAAKAKKAQSYLGSGYKCITSKGHCIDLPKRKFGVDIKNEFAPTYVTMPDSKTTLTEIKKLAKTSDTVYLMADPDREGEAIAWHLSRSMPNGTDLKRVATNAITKDAILNAIANPRELDTDLINAYECRRILDRLVGYKCSYPVTMATGGKSVGRTQSAGLRILGERELEIQKFVPDEYWTIEGVLLSPEKEPITVDIKTPKPLEINKEKVADTILEAFNAGPVVVSKYTTKTASSNPSAPFMTSTLQQAGATYLGMGLRRTMSAAQRLYDSGAITYHRTDSLNIVPAELTKVRSYIGANIAANYLSSSPNVYKGKVKNAQEAHEAIRPTDITKATAGAADSDESRLYDLIRRRVLSSQMTPAKFERRSARFSTKDYVLGASGSKLLFDGFKKVWTYGAGSDTYLPDLKKGDVVSVEKLEKIRKETKPPARYSEGSFVKKLVETGIGRPATFASIIETLKARDYIIVENKAITTTALGLCVLDFLIKVDFCFIDLGFTAVMEEKLDEISNQRLEKLPTLKEFWDRLQEDLSRCEQTRQDNSKTEYKCPKCDKELVQKYSRFGPFFGCGNYPQCKYTAQLGKDGEPVEKVKKEKKVLVLSEFDCPLCKEAKMVKRAGKYGDFYGCSTFPKCKGILDKDGKVPPPPKWKKGRRGKKAKE